MARPDAVALCHGDLKLGYGALEARAAALAERIRARGIPPGSLIAVRLDRSFAQIVALLAAMKAGCAYLAIDPADPPERARRLVDDSDAAAVIAGDGGDVAFTVPLVPIDGDAAPAAPAMLPEVAPTDLAYVVYTSGSTGAPNGVEITHANLANLVDWAVAAFGLGPGDRVSHALGLAFDAAVMDVWPTLAAGATVVLVDEPARASPPLLRRWLLEQGVTVAILPVAVAEIMLAMAWPADTRLRHMLVGGDVLRAYPRPGLPFALFNNYGPSECTVCATCGRVPQCDPGAESGLPGIGMPIAGATIHILDDQAVPVAEGAVGEIWIGGAGVGRGYRRRPELTARKFRHDPFADDPAAIMYRTGDMGRRLPSGEIDFRGRVDRQVKIRGVRIEADEVALGLQRHPGVGSAVVTVRDEAQAGRQLVAYFVPSGPCPPAAAELRRFLSGFLPAAYLPSHFVALATMPLTRNGKVAYADLPAPSRAAPCAGRAPASPVEIRVAAIAAEVLGIASISATEDFFLLGGHSLLATRVVMDCNAAFGIDLALRDFLNAPTVEGLAAIVQARLHARIAAISAEELHAILSAEAP